jgi:uncharacterized metal-binding protein
MPSGRTHDRITLWSLPVVAGVTFLQTQSSNLTLWVSAGFLFGGLMLGPDLDIHSVHYKRWGWLRWVWLPYRGSMRHRSVLSHAPVIGTTLRVLYLGVWLLMFGFFSLAIANEVGELGWTWGDVFGVLGRSLHTYRYQWLAIALGLELGAFSHYIADWIVSKTKKKKSKRTVKSALPASKSVDQDSLPKS